MKGPGRLDWLIARPIAHRGLHDRDAGIIENSRSAVARAAHLGFGIEIDVEITSDGAAIVFHDEMLDRLTAYKGPVFERSLAELTQIPLTGSAEGDLIWTLEDCLAVVAGRVPLIVEIKSAWNGDTRLAERVARTLAAYSGRTAAKSFDPEMVAAVRRVAPAIPRGLIGCAFDAREWSILPMHRRLELKTMVHWPITRPDFVSWDVHDLPNTRVSGVRKLIGAPVIAWTVRTPEEQARAALHADQMIFEGFLP